ncbi:MAG TPA: PKD domain-containing protein [Bacteroidales bacterium]|nr:PKD domain-containing protein [Bacteroidales bacterium]
MNQGGNTWNYGKPLCKLYFSTPNPFNTYSESDVSEILQYEQSIMWTLASIVPTGDWDLTCSLAAMTDSWNNTGARIKAISDNTKTHTFFTLLWEVLQNKKRPGNIQKEIMIETIDQMNSSPCEGTYCYRSDYDSEGHWQLGGIHPDGGWASTYRWCKEIKEQDHGSAWTGNYNGTDYMLLYNLYHIVNYAKCPCYVNYIDRNIVGHIPVSSHSDETGTGAPIYYDYYGTNDTPLRFIAFNTISSTQRINAYNHVIDYILHPDTDYEEIVYTSVAANVTYKAGETIHLKPGFRVEEGSYFHAYIGDIDCSEYGNSKPSDENDYPHNMYTPYFDSLISSPKTPYDLEVEDSTGDNDFLALECPVDTLRFKGINGDTIDELYTYYWDFGNGITSTEVDPVVYYQPGTYNFTLILTDTNGVADTMKIVLEVPDCGTQTGTQEQTTSSSASDAAISIVPNPNNGEMWLLSKGTHEEGCRLVIYDITGRAVYRKPIPLLTGKIQISASGLLNGVYLYTVISEHGNLIAKDKLVIINK